MNNHSNKNERQKLTTSLQIERASDHESTASAANVSEREEKHVAKHVPRVHATRISPGVVLLSHELLKLILLLLRSFFVALPQIDSELNQDLSTKTTTNEVNRGQVSRNGGQ